MAVLLNYLLIISVFIVSFYYFFSQFKVKLTKKQFYVSERSTNGNRSDIPMEQMDYVDVNDSEKLWKEEQIKRKLRIKQVCSRLRPIRRLKLQSFLYDSTHKLLWCKNAKVR